MTIVVAQFPITPHYRNSHIHASPPHPAVSKAAHSSQTFSPSITPTHTYTHLLPLWSCPWHAPSHTLIHAKFGSRVLELGWPKLTSLQRGPFPCISLEAWPVELQGRDHQLEWGAECHPGSRRDVGDLEAQDRQSAWLWVEGQERQAAQRHWRGAGRCPRSWGGQAWGEPA